MSTVEVGRAAEELAAQYLESAGYAIIGRNWRNRWCEIDIVAGRGSQVHIVEVKYRADVRFGYAAEYVSRDKSARLIRAAAAWCQAHSYAGPYQVDVITLEGALERPQIVHLADVLAS